MHRDTKGVLTEVGPHEDTGWREAKREASEESKPADTWILDFQPADVWENKFLMIKPPTLLYLVMAAQAN